MAFTTWKNSELLMLNEMTDGGSRLAEQVIDGTTMKPPLVRQSREALESGWV